MQQPSCMQAKTGHQLHHRKTTTGTLLGGLGIGLLVVLCIGQLNACSIDHDHFSLMP